ncbi:chromosome transmission fidelity protein 18 homolog [Pyxicephalus adspersus]|uniref:chromosome transmission fidelity protein 18 homolog n=1 Tax=Pyxicephalus adspersus TaxID=30357 RepID=UPI003B5A86FC
MEEEYELYGIEDDYEEQFASELEVLAELEAEEPSRPQPKLSKFRNKLTFEEAITSADHVTSSESGKESREKNGGVDAGKSRKRDAAFLHLSSEEDFSDSFYEPPFTPKPKRARIDAVKKLNFGSDDQSANSSAISDDITPPSSPNFTDRKNERNPFKDTSKQGGPSWRSDQQLHLLGVPISYLKEQVADEVMIVLFQMNEFEETESESLEVADWEEEDETSEHNLWVDKYTPKCYTELLSDDYTNRCLLKWLKLWDTVVFGKEKAVKKVKPTTFCFSSYNGPRPFSATCDDRSPDVFKTRIEAATQMKSVLGADERPNCLIIDEIDGAPTVSINMLLSLVNRKDGKDADSTSEGALTKKKKKEGGLLLRPIICICNDQYVPSLRQLRQQAFVLNFPQTLPSRLVQRLYEIVLKQGMKADTGALMALCEKTENDIRSCINTLQFLRGRGKKELNVRTVQTMKIGLKDQNKSLFSVWQDIFQLPKVQRKRIGQDMAAPDLNLLLGNENDPLNLLGRTPLSAMAQRFHHVLHLATATGEYEKLTMGLYDNFLNMKVKESSFGTVCLALDWLEFTDIVNTIIMHGQNFQLIKYLPFLPVAFHLFFPANNIPRIAYPNSHYEAQSKLNQMQNVLNSMISEISPYIRTRVGPQSLVLDALCLLLDIISPKMRPVNTQLYSMKEKQQLAELINTMLAYNLTYHQERTMEGQYVYKLDPCVSCHSHSPLFHMFVLNTVRSINIWTENFFLIFVLYSSCQDTANKNEEKDAKKTSVKPAAKPGTLNHEQRLENIMKKTAFEEKPEKDFFGRQIVKKVVSTVTVSTNQEEPIEKKIGTAVGNSHVWFRFNEGVSNAVRRNVYIKDLM